MPPERFRPVTALPPDGGWRAELALDRLATPPRPVSLARVPPAVSGDAVALAALARGVDHASRVSHPSLVPVLGLVEAGGGLAVLSPFREGETLRAVLDGGGPLTPALASRVVGDVARAVQVAHATTGPGGRPLAHGAIRPEVVLVAEDGAVLLSGLGRPVQPPPLPEDDLHALAHLLAACLAGEGAVTPSPELAALASDLPRVERPATAAAFAEALAAAAPPAAPGALVARVDSAIPKGATARASRRRALAQALVAEAGGVPEEPTRSPPPGPMVVPALPPAPRQLSLAIGAPATSAVGTGDPRAGGLPEAKAGTSPPPLAGRALAAAAPGHPVPSRRPEPGRPAPTPAPVVARPSLLDDPGLQRLAAAALGLLGASLGFWLGRR